MNAMQGSIRRALHTGFGAGVSRPQTQAVAAQAGPAGRERAGIALVLVTCFVLFLLVAAVGALLGRNWRAWLPGAEGHPSLLGSIRSAAHSVLPLVG